MTRRSINVVEFWLRLGLFLIPIVAFGSAGYIRFNTDYFSHVDIKNRSYIALVIFVTLLWALVVKHLQLDRIDTLIRIRTGVRTSLVATAYCTVATLSALFFYRDTTFARLFIGTGCALMFLFSLALIHAVRAVIYIAKNSPNGRFPIAIVGTDDWAAKVAQRLLRTPLNPCRVACHVVLPGETHSVTTGPLLRWSELHMISEVYGCREVLVAMPLHRIGETQEIMESLQRLCIPTRMVLNLGDGGFVPDRLFDFYGLPLMDIRPCPVDTVGYALGKRVFDVLFSVLCLIVAAPMMGLIALLIKCTSNGPAFFTQERVSLNGNRFNMMKFRTMFVQDGASSSTQHTSPRDPRVTPFGKFLRKTSLDELPQFINVLKGEMSVVGPRPELTFFVQRFRDEIPSYMTRHNVKSGITGWAQVNGLRGGTTSMAQRIQYDLYYLRNWSMSLDCKIICLTVFKGLIGRNAY
jgi:Undecaprenyl-phosphate glucose phosphotransferase